MGILNITLDSFSDGGKFLSAEQAVEHALRMVEQGADIIDVGGESTRPGAAEVSVEVEMERVLPVIEALGKARLRPSQSLSAVSNPNFPLISIDTYKPEVARAAVESGAHIINDITGLQNPAMLEVARQTGAGAVIMHMQGTPRTMQIAPHYTDVVAEVRNFFRQSLERAIASGLDPMCLALDPGIGFGKTVAHNLELLRNLDSLRVSGRPLLLGVSNKSFIGKVIGSDRMEDRLWPTVALTSFAREKGVNIVRVHEVQPNAQALRMTEAICSGGLEPSHSPEESATVTDRRYNQRAT